MFLKTHLRAEKMLPRRLCALLILETENLGYPGPLLTSELSPIPLGLRSWSTQPRLLLLVLTKSTSVPAPPRHSRWSSNMPSKSNVCDQQMVDIFSPCSGHFLTHLQSDLLLPQLIKLKPWSFSSRFLSKPQPNQAGSYWKARSDLIYCR